ncbi:MAG TPA: hypothetical protein VIZ65_07710 [Cellvibrionaceae bacterium]
MPQMHTKISLLFFLAFSSQFLWAAPEQPSVKTAATEASPDSSSVESARNSRTSAAGIAAGLIGHWFNSENNSTVGLIIQADNTCEMYTERLTNPRSSRGCKVEFYRENRYLIFLKGTDGQCGASADFEFRYIESQQRLDLDTGGDVHFLLEKRQQSPLSNK